MANCHVCFRHCEINEGEFGFCGARTVRDGKVVAYNYGKLSSLALDPIEKKPLNNFFPGSYILSVGSFGCNLRCPFCQNNEISWSEDSRKYAKDAEIITPKELVEIALETRAKGNIGIAFTYNEPLVGYEFVLDTAKLAKEYDLKTVMVTAGTAELSVLDELAPYIDAMNIDLKGFTDDYYKRVIGGNRKQTMTFIEEAAKNCHVELTTLIIPGENDSEEEIRELSKWVRDLENITGKKIPLHISRFFPRFKMTDRDATDVQKVYRLAELARENLEFVYTGNC
ncbi:AmmeMemoRadiSam system radical SAM enzyme [Butyrivibrio sp. X503]|uniref:AmmeMemoRadiSam system radical SAM enzyme n=1 Tax=Butyrivibrio sp. X503 TaxID=2364878 RepID=UPI000EA9EA60|nr:AmmeMemoRadiSam system radical SAM enzyme [Butyrivibrio sp. X503]RKM54702.1 AmmeMemoRadiSam system radical SAM enzyme [Butyrivibrio sp. X503]